jgi:dTDP-4-dehydrorhamnose 3,5-epimerase
MNFEIINQNTIKDLVVIKSGSFEDFRGQNFEGFSSSKYNNIFSSESEKWAEEKPNFCVDSFSRSRKKVLRGFHGDTKTWKLIQVLYGTVLFAVIDTRKDSPSFNNCFSTILSLENKIQVLVPKGCVNAHLCLSDECVFHYKLTHEYVSQEDQIHVHWQSSEVLWPVKNPIVSQRDS